MWTYEGEKYVPMPVSHTFVAEVRDGHFQQFTNRPLIVVAAKDTRDSLEQPVTPEEHQKRLSKTIDKTKKE